MDIFESKMGPWAHKDKQQVDNLRGKKETGIGPILTQKQKEFYPPDAPYTYGHSAKLWSSDIPGPGFFEQIASYQPDGYIVGVGAGAIFTFVRSFPKDHPPKGMVICDKQPEVIPFARLFIRTLAESPTADALKSGFFEISEKEYLKRIRKTANAEDEVIKRRYKSAIASRFIFEEEPLVVYREGPNYASEMKANLLDIPAFILENFDIFHNLAVNGNIAIAFADFNDSRFIAAVRELPDFLNSTNIIYSSNISSVGGKEFPLSNLRAYEQGARPNIFIDSIAPPQSKYGLTMRASRILLLEE